jgi:hypothetical protein
VAPTALTFEAVIYRRGILRAVDVPAEFAAQVAEWAFPPVVVGAGGVERQTTLVPRAEGGLRLFLHDHLRKAAGVDTGEAITVALRLDDAPLLPIPDDMMLVASGIEGGLETVEVLPPGLRRQMLDFLAGAKQPETRRKRLLRVAELLEARAAKLRKEAL